MLRVSNYRQNSQAKQSNSLLIAKTNKHSFIISKYDGINRAYNTRIMVSLRYKLLVNRHFAQLSLMIKGSV